MSGSSPRDSRARRRLLVIAVDGPSAAGKGTLARRLADHLRLAYLDSGLLYRAVAFRVLQSGAPLTETVAAAAAKSLTWQELANPQLRDDRTAQAASVVAAMPAVRAGLLERQRTFAAAPPDRPDGPAGGVVIDGRDIGTVVCPDAIVKLFVTASLEARATRRHQELLARYGESIYSRVLEDMKARDERDRTRPIAPMMPAPDALVIDTTTMSQEEAFVAALAHIGRRWQGDGGRP